MYSSSFMGGYYIGRLIALGAGVALGILVLNRAKNLGQTGIGIAGLIVTIFASYQFGIIGAGLSLGAFFLLLNVVSKNSGNNQNNAGGFYPGGQTPAGYPQQGAYPQNPQQGGYAPQPYPQGYPQAPQTPAQGYAPPAQDPGYPQAPMQEGAPQGYAQPPSEPQMPNPPSLDDNGDTPLA